MEYLRWQEGLVVQFVELEAVVAEDAVVGVVVRSCMEVMTVVRVLRAVVLADAHCVGTLRVGGVVLLLLLLHSMNDNCGSGWGD